MNELLWGLMKVLLSAIVVLFSMAAVAEKIEYEIYEISSGEKIGSGIKIYSKNDVILRPYTSNGTEVIEKHIELEQGFKIGARIISRQSITGFGLVAELTAEDFSWEWYKQINGSFFKKIQGEKGLVKIRVSGLPVVEILEEVQFLEDATLSFKLGGAGNAESHDVVIKKGSILRFD